MYSCDFPRIKIYIRKSSYSIRGLVLQLGIVWHQGFLKPFGVFVGNLQLSSDARQVFTVMPRASGEKKASGIAVLCVRTTAISPNLSLAESSAMKPILNSAL